MISPRVPLDWTPRPGNEEAAKSIQMRARFQAPSFARHQLASTTLYFFNTCRLGHRPTSAEVRGTLGGPDGSSVRLNGETVDSSAGGFMSMLKSFGAFLFFLGLLSGSLYVLWLGPDRMASMLGML